MAREIHHRVKNNLQVVSSLLSVQAREATSDEAARAYRGIQRRVNALALVHRWMYEGDDGAVDLKSLVVDLCAAFEGATDLLNRPITIRYELDRVTVGQDVAVPIAFLLTEILSAAEQLADGPHPTIALGLRMIGPRAEITLESDIYRADRFAAGRTDAASRIVRGMARQLRTELEHRSEAGCYRVTVPRLVPES